MDISQQSQLEPQILNGLYARLEDVLSLPKPEKTELDLGCGTGGFAVAVAKAFPDRSLLAADVMLGRLRKVMKLARRNDVENIRILRIEARHLLGSMMPDRYLDRLHILCPDPWPKQKHKSHRLLCSDFMPHLHRVLKAGGVFHFASDDVPYVEAVFSLVEGSGLFARAGEEAIADVLPFKTDFEKSWLELGRQVPHFAWRRKD
jgi:tRNA (guanine-N7-)-methyltransferase